mmetsp:Transcript_31099/g.50450  ORF Transcript_31099/g.50450 Transcript_31099/m.50450 type:complete len:588 (-) Transcript_31099:45-1808(-)
MAIAILVSLFLLPLFGNYAAAVEGAPPLGFLPNIIIFYADDFGFGDIESYGHPESLTPRLNELIDSGTKLTSFYSASPVCSPSRAALLTGRFPTRTGVWGPTNSPLVFYQASIGGLPLSEITIAEFLKMNGLNYTSAVIGKWHLGISNNGQFLPLNQGFDFFTGLPTVSDDPNPPFCFPNSRGCWPSTPIDPWNESCPDSFVHHPRTTPYTALEPRDRSSDDIDPAWYGGNNAIPPNPLYLNHDIVQQPVNITMTPDYYTSACLHHISNAITHKQPFFLYMAFHQTHHPQFASSRFFNTSQRGMFGDAVQEMDFNIGVVVDYLKQHGIEDETLIIFTSDNGPALMRETRGGNAGPLKCGKGTTYEGGVRVPAVVWMPGQVAAGRVTRGLGSTLDVLPTIADLVGQTLPSDRAYDGVSMFEWLFHADGESKRTHNMYWPKGPNPALSWQQSLHAIRYRQWKLHWIVAGSHCNNDYMDADCRENHTEHVLSSPLLFNLYHDVAESYPLDITQPYYASIVGQLNQSWSQLLDDDTLWAKSQILLGSNNSLAPCCDAKINDCYPDNKIAATPWPDCCVCDKINASFPMFVS